MKAKRIIGILAGFIICSMFSTSQGADRFYYGTYGGFPESDFSSLSDSLKFNIVYRNVAPSDMDQYVRYSLRAIVGNSADDYSPAKWATQSHYTLWEAEGLPGSYYGFTYIGGTLVRDRDASGGEAMRFGRPGPPGTVQTGPGYDQKFEYSENDTIPYTADFRLKSIPLPDTVIPQSMGGPPPEPVCKLKVVGDGQVLAERVIYENQFAPFFVYKTFELTYHATQNPIEFQIYWFGTRTLYIDYVKVYDYYGSRLIDDPTHEVPEQIKAYVDQDWVHTILPNGDTVVYRWYLRDEPQYIDVFEPARYIDSLLRQVSLERVGFQAFSRWGDEIFINEYFLRQNPEEYHVDIYPTRWYAPDSSGEAFQQGVSALTTYLNQSKQEAEDREKDFWVTTQGHYFGRKTNRPDTCSYGALWVDNIPYPGWYCYYLKRPPTPNEVRLQTFLSLCYGANSILNFCYYSYNQFVYGDTCLMLGLYEHMGDSTTARWREIRDFTGPRVEALGPVFNQLTWQGAGFYEDVATITGSFIDSIAGKDPNSTYVEVGFFERYDEDYFMLVNRKCLETEHETLSVYFPFMPDGPYLVTDMFLDEPVAKICGVNPCVEVALEPGEGRLFKLQKYHWAYVMFVPQQYSTIQSAIDMSNDFTTILVNPGITYYENINFMGRNPTVTSYLHLSPEDTALISNTVIDGCSLTVGSDSGSVVRFVSGESSCATLKGFTIRNGSGTICIDKGKLGTYGGGIYCKYSSPTIVNNIITENSVTDDGGGIVCRNASPQILNNLIKENEAGERGGGIAILPYFQVYTTPIIANNIIVHNVAQDRGGGIFYHASPFIVNNTIDSNSAVVGGGIYVNSDYYGHIENNIITNSLGGNGISAVYGPQIMAYNDVWYNDSLDFDITYPDSVGDMGWGQNRNGTPCDQYYNICQDPYFYDGYHLDGESPCVGAGDNEAPYLLPTDFEGNPRVVDFVDMGAYEYQGGYFAGGGAKIAQGDTTVEIKSPASAPKAFELSQNYPNPFNPVTTMQFTVGGDEYSPVTLKIYNLSGQLVRTLVDEVKAPGTYVATWDRKNNSGKDVASGIYFYQLKSENFKETKRMVLIK